jgi:SNF2 family DNA or RNA helicase/DNA-directed RNA polymerase subunit RPC12/RpoP
VPPTLEGVTPHTVPLGTFLQDFSDSLCTTTANQLTPLYTPEIFEAAQPIFQQFGKSKTLLPAQANIAAAMAHAFTYANSAICSAEMSTGKTLLGGAVAALLRSKRTLVLCPPHLTIKWSKELRELLPGVHVSILRSMSDIRAFAALPVDSQWPLFGILSRERAKLSHGKRPALIPKTQRTTHHDEVMTYQIYLCPQCGKRVDTSDDIPVTPQTLKPGQQCKYCRSPLWTFDPEGPRRFALADFIGKQYPRLFDLLLGDECQEFKARGSAQGLAFSLLINKCRRVLALTGTLSSGKATSLFHILWRTNPLLRTTFKGSDEPRWVDLYGTWETRTTDEQLHKVLVMGKESKRRVHVSVHERPGISPHLIPHLVSNTAFFQLRDLGLALPPYREHVKECHLEGVLAQNYERLKAAARMLIPLGRRTRDGHLVSSVIQALLAYPDRAWQGESITDNTGVVRFSLDPLDEGTLLPKEQDLIELIKQERSAGRRVLVYCTHTQTRDITKHLDQILQRVGFRSSILPATVPPERRMQWIDDRTAQGLDVLITNPRLVSTGLDLIDYPTLAWFEVDYSTYLVRQASRRSWRPFLQKRPVHVQFLLYKQTMQEHAWALVAAGIKSALQTEGDLTGSELSQYQQPDDIMTQLVQQVLDHNASVLSAESMFAELAALYEQDRPAAPMEEPAPEVVYPPTPPERQILVAPTRSSNRDSITNQLSLFAA